MKKLKLENGAFISELLATTGENQNHWDGDEHEKFASRLLSRLRDENGEASNLDELQRETLMLIVRPTEERQTKVLNLLFNSAEYELDKSTESAFVLLFNVVQFGDYLSKKVNPKTNKPFIIKPSKKGKKKTLDDLLAEEDEGTAAA
jgi:hypothetical protein